MNIFGFFRILVELFVNFVFRMSAAADKKAAVVDDLAEYFEEYGYGDQSEQDALFNEATIAVRKKAGTLDKKVLLYFYGRFKFANEGPNTTPRPTGFLNFEAKAKWQAWRDLPSSMTKEQAINEYIAKLDEVLPNWRSKTAESSNADKGGTFGIKISMMSDQSQALNESDKNCFDFIRENSLDKLKSFLAKNKPAYNVNSTDENGVNMLMNACDLGHLDIAKFLVQSGIDLNAQDPDGQTCLHYAVTCEHPDIVEYLVSLKNLRLDVPDNDGLTPLDLADNKEIKQALQKSLPK